MSLFRQIVKRTLMTMLPRDVIASRGAGPGIALTFDDGPHPEHTPRLLDALQTAGIPATFFVVGQRASKHRDLLQRILDDGHEIGNHTWSHSEPRQTPVRQFIDEVRRTRELIEDVSGRACRLFRPPKGELTFRKLSGLLREGQQIILWNRDTRDYRMTPGQDEMSAWWCDYQPADGDIVLMHDNHPHAIQAVEYLTDRRPDLSHVCQSVSAVLDSSHSGRTVPPSGRMPCTGW